MEGGAVGGGASVGGGDSVGGGSVGGRVGSAPCVAARVGRGVRVNLRVRVGASVRVADGSRERISVAVAVLDGSGVTIWASEAKREPGVWAKAGFGLVSSPPTHATTTDGPPPIIKPTAKLNRMAPATIARALIIPTVSCIGVALRVQPRQTSSARPALNTTPLTQATSKPRMGASRREAARRTSHTLCPVHLNKVRGLYQPRSRFSPRRGGVR